MKIILIRHGESKANVDPDHYAKVMDHNVELTDKGVEQAKNAGRELQQHIDSYEEDGYKILPSLYVFYSPYIRTKKTWENIKSQLSEMGQRSIVSEEESYLIREQEYKIFANQEEARRIKDKRKIFGIFWYRFKHAESVADVCQRIQVFINNLWLRMLAESDRDRNKEYYSRPNEKIYVIVTHEVAIRAFLMILKKLPVDTEKTDIANGSLVILDNAKIKYF